MDQDREQAREDRGQESELPQVDRVAEDVEETADSDSDEAPDVIADEIEQIVDGEAATATEIVTDEK